VFRAVKNEQPIAGSGRPPVSRRLEQLIRRPEPRRNVGWRLEHVGYFYMITSETSSDRMFLTGEATPAAS